MNTDAYNLLGILGILTPGNKWHISILALSLAAQALPTLSVLVEITIPSYVKGMLAYISPLNPKLSILITESSWIWNGTKLRHLIKSIAL